VKKLTFLFLLFISFQGWAQEGDLSDDQISVVKYNRKITLPEAGKPQEKVTIKLKDLPKVKQKYSYREFSLQLPLLDPKLNPPVLKNEPEEPVKEGFVRLGAGNYGSTLFDAYYNSGRSKDYAYGLFLNHLASANGPVDNSGFSNNRVGAYGKYFTPGFTIDGDLTYSRDRYNFYGYDPEVFKNRSMDSIKQVLQKIWFHMELESARKNKPLQYKFGIGVGNFSDQFNASETEVGFDLNGKYQIKDSSRITLFTDITILKRTDSSAVNRSLFRIEPVYRFGFKGFQLHAGFNIAVNNEPELNATGDGFSDNKSSFHIYPVVGIQQNILKNRFVAFAGVKGGMTKKTLRGSVEINPFLGPDVYLRNENQLYNLYIGLKGQSKGQFQYRTQVSFEKLNQQAFFLNNEDRREQFDLVYDSSSTNRFTWETELTYDLSAKTRAGLRYSLIRYGTTSLAEPWHAPNSILSLFGRQALSEKLMLSGEFYYMGGLRGFNWEKAETEKIKGIADLNLKAEYFFKKRYSGFLSVHNLLNNKNQRFLHYPTQGLRVMVGASAIF